MILCTWLIKDFKVKFGQFLYLSSLAAWEFFSSYKVLKIPMVYEDLNKDIYTL
jgi:hypothetical protein